MSGPAAAQDDGGGIDVGGGVPSVLSLSLTASNGFSTFASHPKHRFATLVVNTHVTATDPGTQMSVSDGDAASGPRRGRLTDGRWVMSAPLTASVNGGFASL